MFPACGPPNLVSSNETPKCSALLLSRALIFEATKYGGPCLVSRGVHPTFYHKFFIPDHPLHQSGIFLMYIILNRKENHYNKNERNGWVVGVLWGFEPFSHGNHHSRVYMHHVCLIQSISARKATHMKLGTRSGSSQCQLHFGTKMVSMGWSGCE